MKSIGGGNRMREEYDIKNLNPRKNPYRKITKKQVTININESTIHYFKEMAKECGVPYQTLINLYLDDCVKQKRKLQFI